MDVLPKKHLPPISTSLPFEGISAVHISHDSSIATQNQKIYQNIGSTLDPILTSIGRCSYFLVNSITSDFEAYIVEPTEKKKTFNYVQAV
jgi:hypothetical protein